MNQEAFCNSYIITKENVGLCLKILQMKKPPKNINI